MSRFVVMGLFACTAYLLVRRPTLPLTEMPRPVRVRKIVRTYPPLPSTSEPLNVQDCIPTSNSVHVRYDFVMGKDGLKYLMNSDEADSQGWLDTLVDIRQSVIQLLDVLDVADDWTIKSADDLRLSKTEYANIKACLSNPEYSGINSISSRDTHSAGVTGCNGRAIFISSRDYYAPRNWRQQNVHYVLHELAHVAMGGPSQLHAHTLEFFRVFHVLTKAAETLGPKVFRADWYAWPIEENRNVLGAWIGTDSWWDFAKTTLGSGFRWDDTRLVPGKDTYVEGTGSLVRIR